MKFKIIKNYTRVSPDNIEFLEKKIKGNIPIEYKKFLLESNGGRPDVNVSVDILNHPHSPTDLQVFFGINRDIKSENIEWYLENFSNFTDINILPIACDSGGGVFLINMKDYTIWYSDDINTFYLFPVSSNFELFLETIEPDNLEPNTLPN